MAAPKILALVEATTVNAVARNVIDFHRSANELAQGDAGFAPVEVSVVTFSRQADSPPENDFIAAARAAGLQVDVISERGRFDRRIIPALREIIDKRKPDVIVTHSVKSHFVMFRSKLWRALPWIAYHHGYTSTDLKMRFYNLFDRRSLPKADRVVTVCQAFAAEMVLKKGVKNISVLHNSIRPAPRASEKETEALRDQLRIEPGDKIVLSVGRLSKEKAQADLIRAFAHLLETNPGLQAKLVIVGDGPERANLAAQTASSGIADRVVFAGQVRNVQPYYALADVLANSSHSEGSPYVLLEAMAAGVPIVATAVGGVPEMLTNGESGMLVPPKHPQALAQALWHVLDNKAEANRLSRNANARATTQFSPEAYVTNLLKIYQDVIDVRAISV